MEIIREQGKIVKENQQRIKFISQQLGISDDAEKIKPVRNKTSQNEKDKKSLIIANIIAEHDSPNTELFTKLLSEGAKLLEKHEEKESFRMLERAALLSPRNISLLAFVAKTYFFADKFSEAKKYLEKAFELEPDNFETLLLLGTIYADEAEIEKARRLLSILAENENTSRVVNFIWGITAAFEENWTESIAAFKMAMGNAEFPELHYLIGCVYFHLKDEVLAVRHWQRAISLDRKYSDAWFMQAVIYHSQMDVEREKNMLQNASEMTEAGAQCLEFLRKHKLNPEIALPFQHFKKIDTRLLTNGALRLTRFFRNEIGKAIE